MFGHSRCVDGIVKDSRRDGGILSSVGKHGVSRDFNAEERRYPAELRTRTGYSLSLLDQLAIVTDSFIMKAGVIFYIYIRCRKSQKIRNTKGCTSITSLSRKFVSVISTP